MMLETTIYKKLQQKTNKRKYRKIYLKHDNRREETRRKNSNKNNKRIWKKNIKNFFSNVSTHYFRTKFIWECYQDKDTQHTHTNIYSHIHKHVYVCKRKQGTHTRNHMKV